MGALGPESLYLAALTMAGEDNKSRLMRLNRLMKPVNPDAIPFRDTPDSALQAARLNALKNFNILVKGGKPATPTFAYMTNTGPRMSLSLIHI